jgi:hypothetical protein
VHDERDRLWQLILRLPPMQRAVVVLRFYEQLSGPKSPEPVKISIRISRQKNCKVISGLSARLSRISQNGYWGPCHEFVDLPGRIALCDDSITLSHMTIASFSTVTSQISSLQVGRGTKRGKWLIPKLLKHLPSSQHRVNNSTA